MTQKKSRMLSEEEILLLALSCIEEYAPIVLRSEPYLTGQTKLQYFCVHLACRELPPHPKHSMCKQDTTAKHATCFNFVAFKIF